VWKSQKFKHIYILLGRTRPTIVGLDQSRPKIHGLGWAHISWLLCMSTLTSFASPGETCTVHVLHGKGRNKSNRKRGGGFTWRSLSRQWWPPVAVVPGGGPSSSLLCVFLYFSLLFFFRSSDHSPSFSFLFFSFLSVFRLFCFSCAFF